MDYVIIVNDNGELKTITAEEIDNHHVFLADNALEDAINYILDEREEALGIKTNIDTRIDGIPDGLEPGFYECKLNTVELVYPNTLVIKADFVGEDETRNGRKLNDAQVRGKEQKDA